MDVLIHAFGWTVHPLAGITLAFFAAVLFSARRRSWWSVLLFAGVLLLLVSLGAGWAVHPAAALLLVFLGVQRRKQRWPLLLAALVSAALFMVSGATWLVVPAFVALLVWLFRASRAVAPRGSVTQLRPQRRPLPQEASGHPMGLLGVPQDVREAIPAARGRQRARGRAAQQADVPADTLQAFMFDERLPPEARAQLAALDARTREAIAHLSTLEGEGSEALYLARAVRDKYAPTAVRAYLKLPRTLADTQPLQDGKTGRDLLREQLSLLQDAMQDTLGAALRADGQDLLTHQRFLQEKFSRARNELDV